MSIGKNAIKRVENNGYSNVKTEAPDMVNSTVIGATSPEVIEMVEKEVQKQVAPKKAPAKKPSTTKTTAPKTKAPEKKVEKKETSKNFFAIGDDIPVYYL